MSRKPRNPNNEPSERRYKPHAVRRARGRHGIRLRPAALRLMCEYIRNGHSEVLEKQSNNTSVHRVRYNGTYYRVVYAKKQDVIKTILPEDV